MVKNLDFFPPDARGYHGDIKQGGRVFVVILAAQPLALLPIWKSLVYILLMGECAQPCSIKAISAPSSQGTGSDPGWADWALPSSYFDSVVSGIVEFIHSPVVVSHQRWWNPTRVMDFHGNCSANSFQAQLLMLKDGPGLALQLWVILWRLQCLSNTLCICMCICV